MPLLLGILPEVYPLARTQSHGHTKMQQENLGKAVFVAVSQLISGKHVEDKNGYWKVNGKSCHMHIPKFN